MPQIRELGIPALRTVYRHYIRKDFPRQERRPLSAMESAMKKGRYKAWGYYEGPRLTAYATFYFCSRYPFALLDYYAVVDGLRGKGIGSAFLKDLLPLIPVKGGILIEAESPASAKKEEERRIRRRRVDFYEKNGAGKTGIHCRLFGVDYNILYYPKHEGPGPKNLTLGQVKALYLDLYGKLPRALCRPYKAEDTP